VNQGDTLRLLVLALIVVAITGFLLGIELVIQLVLYLPGLLFAVVVGPVLFARKRRRRLILFIIGTAVASFLIVMATLKLTRMLEGAMLDHSLLPFGVAAALLGGLGAVVFCLWLGLLNSTGLLQFRIMLAFFTAGAVSQIAAVLFGFQFESILFALCASLWWGSIGELLVRIDESWRTCKSTA
jgi:hypothetical protein